MINIQVYRRSRNIHHYIVLSHFSFSEQAQLIKEKYIKEKEILLHEVGKYMYTRRSQKTSGLFTRSRKPFNILKKNLSTLFQNILNLRLRTLAIFVGAFVFPL
jgi:hypothetical protein